MARLSRREFDTDYAGVSCADLRTDLRLSASIEGARNLEHRNAGRRPVDGGLSSCVISRDDAVRQAAPGAVNEQETDQQAAVGAGEHLLSSGADTSGGESFDAHREEQPGTSSPSSSADCQSGKLTMPRCALDCAMDPTSLVVAGFRRPAGIVDDPARPEGG
jgi:hypothetical protein